MTRREWEIKSQYNVVLFDLVQQNIYGIKKTPCLYIIKCNDEYIYIGQTSCGVTQRIKQHISSLDDTGTYIYNYTGKYGDLICYVILIRGNIDGAEMTYIHHFNPQLNRLKYLHFSEAYNQIKHRILPLDQSKFIKVPGATEEWERKYNPVNGIKFKHEVKSDYRSIINADVVRYDDRCVMLDNIYSRAYRDPNHPELAK